MAQARDIHLEHLHAELTRIDVMVRHQARLMALAGQDSKDTLRGLHIGDAQAAAVAARPIASSWASQAQPSPKVAAAYARELARAEAVIRTAVQAANAPGDATRLMFLAHAFGLSRFELDAFLIALAPQIDLRYEQLFGFLNDDVTRKRATVNLVLDLVCEPGLERLSQLVRFTESAPLFAHGLLMGPGEGDAPATASALLARSLQPDPVVLLWLLGDYVPGAGTAQPDTYAGWRVMPRTDDPSANSAEWLDRMQSTIARDKTALVSFHGADSAAQLVSAGQLLARLDRAGLYADLSLVLPHTVAEAAGADGREGEGAQPSRAVEPLAALTHLRRALRDARMMGAVAVVDGWEACLSEGVLPGSLFQALQEHPDTAILLSRSHWHVRGGPRNRRVLRRDFGMPQYQQRRGFWEAAITNGDTAEDVLQSLSGQFALTSAQISDSVQAARDLAAQRGDVRPSNADMFAAARMHVSPRLSMLARKITPRHGWGDIILPDDQIATMKELVAMVRNRPTVLEGWEVGRKLVPSAGVTTMFAGPPGTGKTMSAEVIAAHLELDLYKIDLSSMVSKYIGETEKNLEKIFREAERSNAILFFDEADAIFGKRGDVRDANDRYANIEVSYLLQRMEAYDGVTILATNLRSNLDEAFIRRLQFVVDFPFPDETYRLRLWRNLFPSTVPHEPDLDFETLARRFKLSGGNIRNVIVGACYLAANDGAQARVTNDHLSHSLRRELQKMGRLV